MALATILTAPSGAAFAAASLPDIEDEVMCPICGTMLELSNSPQAERERVFIRRLIAEGRSKEQIKDALVAEYGPEVLAVPDTEGFDLVAWLLPGLAIITAGGAITVAIRRWRAEPASPVPPVSSEDRARIDEDIKRYDAE